MMPIFLKVIAHFPHYQFVIAGGTGIDQAGTRNSPSTPVFHFCTTKPMAY